jgi:RNase H-fold protein (predicted Holliday junction resolvase)
LPAALATIVATHPIDMVALGRGTNSAQVAEILTTLGLPHTLVDEHETTLRARGRFFADHPPRGWKRFVPRGMLLPDRPVDDYAALLIAERYLTHK